MAEKSYAHRDVLDKLGVKEEARVVVEGPVPADLVRRMEAERGVVLLPPKSAARRSSRARSEPDAADLVLYRLTDPHAVEADLGRLRARITPAGAIWVMTAKRGRPGYLMQEELIPVGKRVGLIDNKACSVDEETSGLRFVIPRNQR